jgi:glycosyltransferase involved in cell wall biosynthesis
VKILVLTSLYPPFYIGGYELQCKMQVDELRGRGHEIHVLTSRWGVTKPTIDGDTYRLLDFDAYSLRRAYQRVRRDPLQLRFRYSQLRWLLSCRHNYDIARKVLEMLQPDLVYVWHMPFISLSPLLAAQDYGIRSVISLGDYWLSDLKIRVDKNPNPIRKRYKAALEGLRDFSDLQLGRMHAVSHALKHVYVEQGFAARDIAVSPCGIPVALMREDLPDPWNPLGPVRLLFAGRLVAAKGPDVAVEALAHLRRRLRAEYDIGLDLIGEGANRYVAQLNGMARARGLAGRVSFAGRVENDQLLRKYETYSALLFTSRWPEPFAVTILEAMGRGLPVVATDRGGTPEIVVDGETGLLVPADDPRALADAVERLLREPLSTERMRRNALSVVREQYAFERIVDAREAYLEMALAEAGRIS